MESGKDAVISSSIKQFKDKSTLEVGDEPVDEDEEKEDSLPEL